MTALVWDLDGTLLDSYRVIVPCTTLTLREAGIELGEEEIHRRVIAGSVGGLLRELAPDRDLWPRYRQLAEARDGEVRLMPGAAEALEEAERLGMVSFVYTHKGASARTVLERLGIAGHFRFILDLDAGLPRKPDPAGINWLVDRFGLDRRDTFYIGDRPIDMLCAGNAGVPGILFLPPGGVGAATGAEAAAVEHLPDVPRAAAGLRETWKKAGIPVKTAGKSVSQPLEKIAPESYN